MNEAAKPITDEEREELREGHVPDRFMAVFSNGHMAVMDEMRKAYEALLGEMELVAEQIALERDIYENYADRLSLKIAEAAGVDIGEHSNVNHPWQNALDVALQSSSWRPIEEAHKNGEPFLARGGVYHGYPFVCVWEPSEYFPDQPWRNYITKSRCYEHCVTHGMPIQPLPEGE